MLFRFTRLREWKRHDLVPFFFLFFPREKRAINQPAPMYFGARKFVRQTTRGEIVYIRAEWTLYNEVIRHERFWSNHYLRVNGILKHSRNLFPARGGAALFEKTRVLMNTYKQASWFIAHFYDDFHIRGFWEVFYEKRIKALFYGACVE